jgi:hypothetical protein
MSIQKRKLSYWGIDFWSGKEHSFDALIFNRFMHFINTLSDSDCLFRDEKHKKAVALESIKEVKKQGLHLYEIIFKSCKYEHSPDYMSSRDGSERPTEKQLYEGDKELTHMCLRIDENEAYTVFEQRRSGVSMCGVIAYMNQLLKKFLIENEDVKDDFCLWSSCVPSDDFLTALEKTEKLKSLELFVENKVIGSDYLNVMDMDDNARDDIQLTMTAKPRKSLLRSTVKSAFLRLTTGGTEIKRIRVRGTDINKMSITLDSLDGKKLDEITVDLLNNGIVDSYSIFSKIEGILGVTE